MRPREPFIPYLLVRQVTCMALVVVSLLGVVFTPAQIIAHLAQLVLFSCLAIALCRHHGVMPPRTERPQVSISRAQPVVATAAYALLLYWLANPLYQILTQIGGPVQRTDLTTASAYSGLAGFITQIIWSGTIEELVVTAAVVALLAVRRPLWECLLVSALMRAIPHLYFGLPALAMVALGISCAALYYRYRRVLPLVITHIAYNLITLIPPYTDTALTVALALLLGATLFLAVPSHTTRQPRRSGPSRTPQAERDRA
ncbi:CPBP family intramembrane glutamic endopeptidase [Streptomyces sp. NPDC088846]|uniref:CPBP family intramembrane glutamic endopeptidase n=1 Tax=Streptomyces sp. NPDC088846 TaxID=3365908 RepID=UPI003811E014